jgi:transcriptional regulator with GAF, ATPase, and Fis domain
MITQGQPYTQSVSTVKISASSPSAVLIGDHPLMKKIDAIVHQVAGTDTTVLIAGESGTGKELIARALHSGSLRQEMPFVPVNCAAIPEELLESELFGHVRGAFTGAHTARAGMFQLADGGTLFLDEVGDMPLVLQAKLLRVLQDQLVRPVGSDRTQRVDVRVIAATNKHLAKAVEKGAFREDLFYRLQVIPIQLPPLRARRSDIPLLLQHFLEKMNRKYGRNMDLTPEALVHLWEYDWPGNVRELENIVERLVVLSEDNTITIEHLPASVRAFISEKKIPTPTFDGNELNLQKAVELFENRLIDEALRRTNGNRSAAAQILGLKRTTLLSKLRRKRMVDETLSSLGAKELFPLENLSRV